MGARLPNARERHGRQSAPVTHADLLNWTIRYAVPLSGLVAAVIYGVLRLSYALFYQPLRATPEEVGYDYVEILAGQLIGALELALVMWAVLFALVLVWRRMLVRLGRRRRGRPPTDGSTWDRWWRPASRSALVALALVTVLLPVVARELGAIAATQGETMRNIHLKGSNIPVLPVTAIPATVTALAPEAEVLEARRCLLYLGAADGVAVFFDVATKDGVRVPTTAVMISLHNAEHVSLDCVDT